MIHYEVRSESQMLVASTKFNDTQWSAGSCCWTKHSLADVHDVIVLLFATTWQYCLQYLITQW